MLTTNPRKRPSAGIVEEIPAGAKFLRCSHATRLLKVFSIQLSQQFLCRFHTSPLYHGRHADFISPILAKPLDRSAADDGVEFLQCRDDPVRERVVRDRFSDGRLIQFGGVFAGEPVAAAA